MVYSAHLVQLKSCLIQSQNPMEMGERTPQIVLKYLLY